FSRFGGRTRAPVSGAFLIFVHLRRDRGRQAIRALSEAISTPTTYVTPEWETYLDGSFLKRLEERRMQVQRTKEENTHD
ncbi:MAG: hypothetical protein WBM31_04575, partial [Pseudolabrys sp.]